MNINLEMATADFSELDALTDEYGLEWYWRNGQDGQVVIVVEDPKKRQVGQSDLVYVLRDAPTLGIPQRAAKELWVKLHPLQDQPQPLPDQDHVGLFVKWLPGVLAYVIVCGLVWLVFFALASILGM